MVKDHMFALLTFGTHIEEVYETNQRKDTKKVNKNQLIKILTLHIAAHVT